MTHLRNHVSTWSGSDQVAISNLLRKGWVEYQPEYQADYVPELITKLQRNLWLGKSRYMQLTAWINSLPSDQSYEASIYWKDAETTLRNHPLTIAMANVLGMTSDQMDQAFIEASNL